MSHSHEDADTGDQNSRREPPPGQARHVLDGGDGHCCHGSDRGAGRDRQDARRQAGRCIDDGQDFGRHIRDPDVDAKGQDPCGGDHVAEEREDGREQLRLELLVVQLQLELLVVDAQHSEPGADPVELVGVDDLRRVLAMAVASRTFQALGTTAHVCVTDPAALEAAVSVVEDELAAIDLACSRFRDDSELAALNRSGGRPFEAGPLLIEALEVAIRAAALTDGDVDPTIGRSIKGLGWDCDFAVLVSRREQDRFEVVQAAGWRTIRIDQERGLVQVPAGVEIDLGATAKALAADRSACAASLATGSGVLVNLGGDLAVAGAPPTGGWSILVTDDHRSSPDADGQTIAIRGGGLATSSTTVRRWRAGGSEHHHILDPRSGLPADEIWRTVSVAAATCVDANTASTAAVVRGRDALSWLRLAGLPARLVGVDDSVAYAGGWPEETP
jgi:FAD:protein FMN transferase